MRKIKVCVYKCDTVDYRHDNNCPLFGLYSMSGFLSQKSALYKKKKKSHHSSTVILLMGGFGQ